MAGLSLLLGPGSAFAAESPAPAPEPSAASTTTDQGAGLDLTDLPVKATDVTTTDTDLRSTTDEVTVLSKTDDGGLEVTKLRTESASEAKELVSHLDEQPGVVAARTHRLRASAVIDPLSSHQENLRTIGAAAAWRYSRGAGVRVAVIDTGVDATHPDLKGRVATAINLVSSTLPAAAYTEHGTRTASIIAAARNSVGIVGIAPSATILPVIALDTTGVGDTSTVARAIIAAANAGARVINLSLGGPDRDPILDRACTYAFSKGSVVVAAGGNSFDDGNLPQYPAASPNVVGVSSVDAHGDASLFANSGSYIDLTAPGENVLAARPGGGYNRGSGTSFSAPQVSATMALIASANPSLRPSQIVRIAELTAQDDRSADGEDQELGYGIVRPDRAALAALRLRTTPALGLAAARLTSFNASPEPVRKGKRITLRVAVQTRYPSGTWRSAPVPYQVRFEFKAKGSKTYRTVGVTGAAAGSAQIKVTAKKSGRWRAKVLQANGTLTKSKSDYVKVRR